MMGLREDIIEDSFGSYQELIHADVFANYLERADHLLSEGYEDAAAVILGSSLEVQLRKIAVKYSIDLEYIDSKDEIRRKASSVINSDIKKKEVYNEMYRSQIETWLKLRNHAAHGHYDKYDKGDVSRFLSGLRDFILKFPA